MLNPYFYWYYVIYRIYERTSSDKHFSIFATGLFSIVISFWLLGILSFFLHIFGGFELIYGNAFKLPISIVTILVINYVVLLNKNNHSIRHSRYLERRNQIKDLIFVLLSIGSIPVLVYVIILARAYFT